MKYMQIESLSELPSENVLSHADNIGAYQRMTGEPCIIEEIGLNIMDA